MRWGGETLPLNFMGANAGSEQVGSTITSGLDNKPTTLQAIGMLDTENERYKYTKAAIDVTYGGDPGASKKLNIWMTDSPDLTDTATAISRIGQGSSAGNGWFKHEINLISGASDGQQQQRSFVLFSRGHRYLHFAYTIDDITTALSSLKVTVSSSR